MSSKTLPGGAVTMAEIRAVYPGLTALAEGTLRLPPLDPETAQWLDGPWFVKWLFAHGLQSRMQFGASTERRLTDWDSGSPVSLRSADRLLIDLGWSLHDLPDEMWVRPPRRASIPRASLDAIRGEAARRYRNGESPTALAKDYQVTPRTIRGWAARGQE